MIDYSLIVFMDQLYFDAAALTKTIKNFYFSFKIINFVFYKAETESQLKKLQSKT